MNIDQLSAQDREEFAKFGPAVRRWKYERDAKALGEALAMIALAMRRGAMEMAEAMSNAITGDGLRVTFNPLGGETAPLGATIH